MIKKIKNYFFIPKDGKITEKAMMRRIGLYVTAIALCLGAISVSAYAFTTWNMTSGVNVLTTAHFDINVESSNGVSAIDPAGKSYMLTAETEDEIYAFTLAHAGDTATGYCKILISESDYNTDIEGTKWEYFSEQINKGSQKIIEITVPAGKTVYVRFIPEWGTYSGNDAVTEIILKNDATGSASESEQIVSEEQIEQEGLDEAIDTIQQDETETSESGNLGEVVTP